MTPGRELPNNKDGGACRKFEMFSPIRGTNSKTTQSPVIFFQLNILTGTAKAPNVELFRLNTLRDTLTAFVTLKMYYEHPSPFLMGVPLLPAHDMMCW